MQIELLRLICGAFLSMNMGTASGLHLTFFLAQLPFLTDLSWLTAALQWWPASLQTCKPHWHRNFQAKLWQSHLVTSHPNREDLPSSSLPVDPHPLTYMRLCFKSFLSLAADNYVLKIGVLITSVQSDSPCMMNNRLSH